MTTQIITYKTPNATYGSGRASGMLVHFSQEEFDNLGNFIRGNNCHSEDVELIKSIIKRIRPVKTIDNEYPDEILTTMVYEDEFQKFVHALLCRYFVKPV